MRSFMYSVAAGLLAAMTLAAASIEDRPKFYGDDPMWRMPEPAPAKTIKVRKLSEIYDFFENTLFHPGGKPASSGEFLPSEATNTVDEVPDSPWYTNRHARTRMTLDELKRGPGSSHPPAAGTLTIVAAKNEGITPGFVVRDSQGRSYVVKFDPLSNPEMASAADVISSKFFHALGYNVPENYIVDFDRSQLAVAPDTLIRDEAGKKRPIRTRDIDNMLAKVPRTRDGRYRALASLFLPGKPVGPFRYYGTRSDDPNDLVPHEHRRDLRALRTFSAWLGHDDSKALNTLDVLVEAGGVPYVKHYLIDFGASLGSASFEPNSPRSGSAYLFAWKQAAIQFASLGLYVPRWQRASYPDIPAAGRFEYEVFDPVHWVPEYPNAAFQNENPADRGWAARNIMAFTDEDIRAIVSTGEYSDPAAADWVARCLIERRNKIVAAFLNGAAALDGFAVRDGHLEFRDLAAGRSGRASRFHVRWSVFDNFRRLRKILAGAVTWDVPRGGDAAEYLVADISDDSGARVSVYVRCGQGRPEVVGVERDFHSGTRG